MDRGWPRQPNQKGNKMPVKHIDTNNRQLTYILEAVKFASQHPDFKASNPIDEYENSLAWLIPEMVCSTILEEDTTITHDWTL